MSKTPKLDCNLCIENDFVFYNGYEANQEAEGMNKSD